MKNSLLIVFFLFCAGCAGYQTPIPADVVFNENAQGDVLGYHPMPVRAFSGKTTRDAEITGASCLVRGSGFEAHVTTPAAVNIPVYGLRSKALYVECAHNGLIKNMSLAPVNFTEKKVLSNGAAAGLVGVMLTSAIVAARKNQDRDEYGYYDVNMVFKDPDAKNTHANHSMR